MLFTNAKLLSNIGNKSTGGSGGNFSRIPYSSVKTSTHTSYLDREYLFIGDTHNFDSQPNDGLVIAGSVDPLVFSSNHRNRIYTSVNNNTLFLQGNNILTLGVHGASTAVSVFSTGIRSGGFWNIAPITQGHFESGSKAQLGAFYSATVGHKLTVGSDEAATWSTQSGGVAKTLFPGIVEIPTLSSFQVGNNPDCRFWRHGGGVSLQSAYDLIIHAGPNYSLFLQTGSNPGLEWSPGGILKFPNRTGNIPTTGAAICGRNNNDILEYCSSVGHSWFIGSSYGAIMTSAGLIIGGAGQGPGARIHSISTSGAQFCAEYNSSHKMTTQVDATKVNIELPASQIFRWTRNADSNRYLQLELNTGVTTLRSNGQNLVNFVGYGWILNSDHAAYSVRLQNQGNTLLEVGNGLAFFGNSIKSQSTGWTKPTAYTSTKTIADTSNTTVEAVANVLMTLIVEVLGDDSVAATGHGLISNS